MKKLGNLFLILAVILLSCAPLSSCVMYYPGEFPNSGNNGWGSGNTTGGDNSSENGNTSEDNNTSDDEKNDQSDETVVDTSLVACSSRYNPISAPTENGPIIAASYSDYDYNYYVIDLGCVENAPLVYIPELYYNGASPLTLNFEEATVNESSVQNVISKITSETVKTINTGSASVEIGVDAKFPPIKGINLSAHLNSEYSRTWGNETQNTISTENTYATAESVVKSSSYKVQYVVGENNEPAGWYRLTMMSTCDLYLYVKTDSETNEVLERSVTISARPELRLSLDYGGEDRYVPDYSKTSSQPNIEIPEDCYLEYLRKVEFKHKQHTNILYSTGSISVNDSGAYGLNDSDSKRDVIDLSSYSNYFNDDNLFCFYVTVNLNEKNDGYQEIYLYDNNSTTSSIVNISSAYHDYGLVDGVVIEHGPGKKDTSAKDYSFVWYVKGSDVKDKMYVRYDSYGNKEDSWSRNYIKVDLLITWEKQVDEVQVLNNSSEYKITDTGVYGLGQGNHERIDMKKYLNEMTSDHAFIFDVELSLREKDNGHQEVYLYKNYQKTTSTDISAADAINKGLLKGRGITLGGNTKVTSSSNDEWTWCVSGDELSGCKDNQLYIRYDANGDDEDTWHKESITVKLSVFKVREFTTSKNVRTVVD